MPVANLTRRNFVRDSLADCFCGMVDDNYGDYVKFEDAKKSEEALLNEVRQLKAKIADLIKWYDIPRELAIEQRTVNRAQLLENLRQLSAV